MDSEHQPIAPRYWLCVAGFWTSAAGLGLLSLSGALWLWAVLTLDQGLWLALQQPWFTWGVELPITAGALVGSYLLWGRWTDPGWQRRVGLLVLLNLFDSITWGTFQAARLGAQVAALEHEWLIESATMAFGWVEFYLFADLAAEVASHLGVRPAADAGRMARKFAVAGLALSLLIFATQTRWQAGWPLGGGPAGNPADAMMRLASAFLRVIAGMQAATLCAIAGAACRRTARELSREEEQFAGAAPYDLGSRNDADRNPGRADDDLPW